MKKYILWNISKYIEDCALRIKRVLEELQMVVAYIIDGIAWANSNMVGLLSLIGVYWAARKSMGYFKRKQAEKEMRLVEETYIDLMKTLDVLEDIKSQSITMDKALIDGLRSNPVMCIGSFIDPLNDSCKILENHRNIFTKLYEYQLQMLLF